MQTNERPIARKVLDAVRGFYLSRATAGLEITHPGGIQHLFFRAGELFVPPDEPLANLFNGLGGGLPSVLAAMSSWSPVAVRPADVPAAEARLVGPLPTARLIMEAFTLGRSEEELVEFLGGERGRIVARPGTAGMMRIPALEPEDAFLLSRLDHAAALGDILYQGTMDRRSTVARLSRLRAVELIVPAEEAGPSAAGDEDLLPPALFERFSQRIATDLLANPVAMEAASHRVRVAQLLAQCGGMTHYELLDIPIDAGDDQVHRAYTELARLVHPSHAHHLSLVGREGALELLFDRAARAYLTLNDPRRRATYNMAFGLVAGRQGEGERGVERKEHARRLFDNARELVAAEDFHFAVELLRQAVVLDPQAEYYALLADCQMRNPNWTGKALDSVRAGLRLKPNEVTLHVLQAQALEKQGDNERAAEEYLWVCDRNPDQVEAAEGLGRLASVKGVPIEAFLKTLRGGKKSAR